MVFGNIPIGYYTYIFKKNVHELTPYRFEFKWDTNRIWKYFLPMPQFEPESIGWMADALAITKFWYTFDKIKFILIKHTPTFSIAYAMSENLPKPI